MTSTTTPTNTLKEVPKTAKKANIHKWYKGQSSLLLRKTIILAIVEVNKTTTTQYSIHTRNLNAYHIAFIWRELGPPPGFKSIDDD